MIDPVANGDNEVTNQEISDQIDIINLPQPVQTSGYISKKIHECNVCSKRFARTVSLEKHKFKHMKSSKPYSCEVCLKTFARDYQMEKHLRTHGIDIDSGIKPFSCEVCKCLEYSLKLLFFRLYNDAAAKIKNAVCFKSFGREDEMSLHRKAHASNKSLSDRLFELMSGQEQINDVKDEVIIKTEEPYFDEYGERNGVESYYQTSDTNVPATDILDTDIPETDVPVPRESVNIFQCTECSSQFFEEEAFTRHMHIHSLFKPFKCEICSKSFRVKKHLKRHKTMHSKVKGTQKSMTKTVSVPEVNRLNLIEDIIGADTSIHVNMEPGEQNLIESQTPITKDSLQPDLNVTKRKANILQCTLCPEQFPKWRQFNKHMYTHPEFRPFHCEICSRTFRTIGYLKKHFFAHSKENREAHSTPSDVNVPDNTQFQSSYEIAFVGDDNITTDESFQVGYQDLIESHFQTPTTLREPNLNKAKKSGKVFRCTFCPKKFSSKYDLKSHRVTHEDIKLLSCKICRRTFFRQDLLEAHFSKHFGEKGKSLPVSDDVKCKSSSLDETIQGSQPKLYAAPKTPIVFQCTICSRELSSKYNLKCHMDTHSSIKPFSCEICSKSFARQDKLKIHIRTHTKDKSRSQSLNVSEHQSRLINENKFVGDDITIDEKFWVGEQGCIETPELRADLKFVKVEATILKCNVCSKIFSRKHNLDKHKCYSCKICSKTFNRKTLLSSHIRRWHNRYKKKVSTTTVIVNISEDGKLLCAWKDEKGIECGRLFTCSRSLEKHAKIHSDFDLFKCDICSKRFSKKLPLRDHIMRHFPEHFPPNKDYVKCDICSKEFPEMKRLRGHMYTHMIMPHPTSNKLVNIARLVYLKKQQKLANLKGNLKKK